MHREFMEDAQAIGLDGLQDAAQIAARIKKRWLAIAQERAPRPVGEMPDSLVALAQCFAIELVRASKLPGVPSEVQGNSTAVEGKVSREHCSTCEIETYHLDGACEFCTNDKTYKP